MRTLPAKVLTAMSDATIGTAIVMFHLLVADRVARQRGSAAATCVTPQPSRQRATS